MSSIYKKLSEERKNLQALGEVPDWYTTGGYQMFMEKYTLPGQSLKERYQQVAKTAGDIAAELYELDSEYWTAKFFDIIWKGWLSPSTPVLANLGTGRGMPVSCSGMVVGDSIHGFYSSRHETAMLTKHGFGTSAYLGEIRPRGSEISAGGKASGSLPVFLGFVQDMRDVSQGNVRRGSWAGYIEVEHGDFHEIADHLLNNPDDFNIGWIISDEFIARLGKGDKDAIQRYQKIMKIRKITGKGYMLFIDKINAQNPAMYKDKGMKVKASNLCSEISLFSDEDHTFTCVLSSMNLRFYDDWKDTDAVELAIIFLDCVAEAFIRQATGIPGFDRSVRFTEKSRALGLGTMGFHTYLQDRMIAIESTQAHLINTEIYSRLRKQAEKASEWMAAIAGEPEWCKGYGRRNTHLMAIAPNMSTALLCGGVSQGIEPVVANVFNQNTAAGEIQRINPSLLKVMKDRGVYNKQTINALIDSKGSILGVSWLTDEEKLVFRTAFEIDQMALLRLASSRQKFIDQGQSLNLFFAAEEDPKYISQIHRAAAEDPNIKALYYMRSQAGIQAAKDECIACEG
jgi:ribonucleoside-diphosphate reductase alpha chain